MKSLRMPIVLLMTTCVILSSSGDNFSSPGVIYCHCRSAQRRLSGRRSRARWQSGTRESASSVPSAGPRNSNDSCIGNKKLCIMYSCIPIFQYIKYLAVPPGEFVHAFPEPLVPEAEVPPKTHPIHHEPDIYLMPLTQEDQHDYICYLHLHN